MLREDSITGVANCLYLIRTYKMNNRHENSDFFQWAEENRKINKKNLTN